MHTPSIDVLMRCTDQQLLLLDAVLDMLLEGHATRRDIHLSGAVLNDRPGLALTTLEAILQRLAWPKGCMRNPAGELLLTFEGTEPNGRVMAKGGALWTTTHRMTAHTALVIHAARAAIQTGRQRQRTP
jgi:hypothetical protein